MSKIRRERWSTASVKADMGLFRGNRSFTLKFHWKFWRPLDGISGPIWFGQYAEWEKDD